MVEIKNKEDYIGMRVDRFLKKYTDYKNSFLFFLIKQGKIKINGKKTKENYRIQKSDVIEIDESLQIDLIRKYKKKIDLDYGHIVFENDDFFIVYKKKNISMHKGTSNEFGLSEYFKSKYNSNDINFANRLDKKTDGLVIGVKNQRTLRKIAQEIKSRKVEKIYSAIVNVQKVDDNFLNEFREYKKVKNVFDDIEYISYFKLDKKENKKAKFLIKLITGRKHQIRKQFKNMNMPIIGDDKYGGYGKDSNLLLTCIHICFSLDGKEYKFNLEDI